eukprot:4383358-Lingulodinium_polyedra.AAC.1
MLDCSATQLSALGWPLGRALVDSGSAVTAVPWSFGSGCDTVCETEVPSLRSVTGAGIECWGERSIPCSAGDRDVTLQAHVAN